MDVATISSWVLLAINSITLLTLVTAPLRKKGESVKSVMADYRDKFEKQDARLSLQDEAIKCLLRDSLLRIYYSDKSSQSMSQVEAEFISQTYKAYKGLGGNSFIDALVSEMKTWDIKK